MKLLTTYEYAALHSMPVSTVSAYCRRKMIPGAVRDERFRRWMIPKTAKVVRRQRGRPRNQ